MFVLSLSSILSALILYPLVSCDDTVSCDNCQMPPGFDSTYILECSVTHSTCFAVSTIHNTTTKACFWGRNSPAPQCSCQPGFSGMLCAHSSCNCTNTTFPTCQFQQCTCDGAPVDCSYRGCNSTNAICSCSGNRRGKECHACSEGYFGQDCTKCDGCDNYHHCDDGVTGTGKCLSDYSRNMHTTIWMGSLSIALLVASVFSGYYAYQSSLGGRMYAISHTICLFLFIGTSSRGVVIGVNTLINASPEYDMVLEVVMDIPSLLQSLMSIIILSHLSVLLGIRHQHQGNNESDFYHLVEVASSPRPAFIPQIRRRMQTIQKRMLSNFLVRGANTRHHTLMLLFICVSLLVLCLPLLLAFKNSAYESYFAIVRYTMWCLLYLTLCILFAASCSAINPNLQLTSVFWNYQRLRSVTLLCSISNGLRCVLSLVDFVIDNKDLVRPSIPWSNAVFQIAYYISTYLIPDLILLWIVRPRKTRFSTITEHLHSCFIPFELVSIDQIVGGGSSSVVYSGRLLDLTVACKELRVFDMVSLSEVTSEAETLVNLHHPNVIRFHGICFCQPYCYLITELCPNNLFRVISSREATSKQLANILLGICDGMAYLHQRQVIHRDLKPANVLLTSDLQPKICDFGTAKLLRSQTLESTSRVGTPVFMAPEVLSTDEITQYSHLVDVFSFGVLMWCVCSRREPYTSVRTSMVWDLVRQVRDGLRPNRSHSHVDDDRLWSLMERCWATTPSERPEFLDIKEQLKIIFDTNPHAIPAHGLDGSTQDDVASC